MHSTRFSFVRLVLQTLQNYVSKSAVASLRYRKRSFKVWYLFQSFLCRRNKLFSWNSLHYLMAVGSRAGGPEWARYLPPPPRPLFRRVLYFFYIKKTILRGRIPPMEPTKEMGVRNGLHLSTPPTLLTFVLSHFQFVPMGHVAYVAEYFKYNTYG